MAPTLGQFSASVSLWGIGLPARGTDRATLHGDGPALFEPGVDSPLDWDGEVDQGDSGIDLVPVESTPGSRKAPSMETAYSAATLVTKVSRSSRGKPSQGEGQGEEGGEEGEGHRQRLLETVVPVAVPLSG